MAGMAVWEDATGKVHVTNWSKQASEPRKRRLYTKIDEDEANQILGMRQEGRPLRAIAQRLGREKRTITRFLERYRDSRPQALAYIRAKAQTLAERVVELADVDQALDVLSRPNIDVLKPIPRDVAQGTRVLISVSPGQCGAMAEAGLSEVIDATRTRGALPSQDDQDRSKDSVGVQGEEESR